LGKGRISGLSKNDKLKLTDENSGLSVINKSRFALPMKISYNLPGNLRLLFGILRGLTALAGCLWCLSLVVTLGFKSASGPQFVIGEVDLQAASTTLQLKSTALKPDTLVLQHVRGTLKGRLGGDSALRSALLQAAVPYLAVFTLSSYLLFAALHNLCANLEVGEFFNEENLRLIRRIGRILVISSLLNVALKIWGAAIMGGFLQREVTVTGGLSFAGYDNLPHYELPDGIMSIQAGLIVGCLVLALTAAFRQGLKLKDENDLTV
jgi:hypothetical protein